MTSNETITTARNGQNAQANGHEAKAAAAPVASPSVVTPTVVTRNTVMPAAPESAPSHALHDWLNRQRDNFGNRLGWTFAYSVPTVDETPIEQTPLAAGLLAIEAQDPIRASDLRHYYNHRLLKAGKTFTEVLTEEMARLEADNNFAESHNEEISTTQSVLEQERDTMTAAEQLALKALEDGPLIEAHRAAGEKAASVGGVYVPENPSEDCVLRHKRTPLEVVAARLQLPGPHGDANAHLPEWVAWGLSVLVGTLMGLSLGIVTHILEADTLARHLPMVGAFAVVGCGLAIAAKWAIRGTWYRVGQEFYLGSSPLKCGVMLTGALLRSLVVLLVDVVLERQGLMALMQLQSDTQALTGQVAGWSLLDDLVSWVVPLVVTLAYLYCAGDAGYLEGRREEIKNRLSAHQEQSWSETDQARREDPAVQAALLSLANVRDLLRQRDGQAARIAALAAPFDAKIALLEGQRLPEREDLSTTARQRIQEAGDNYRGAQSDFDTMWKAAHVACGGNFGFWHRLFHAIGGDRASRRTSRDKRGGGK